MDANEVIEAMGLFPHPEGGYFLETYRSAGGAVTSRGSFRNWGTSIFYLLKEDAKSRFHRLASDEIWYFHQGETLELFMITDGKLISVLLGNDILNGEKPQVIIPGGTWFGGHVKNEKGYSLVSCAVCPGFDYRDFEMAKREELIIEYPHLKEIITIYT